MRLFFDESGDFAFPLDRFACYVQAGVICPDSYLEALGDFADDRLRSRPLIDVETPSCAAAMAVSDLDKRGAPRVERGTSSGQSVVAREP